MNKTIRPLKDFLPIWHRGYKGGYSDIRSGIILQELNVGISTKIIIHILRGIPIIIPSFLPGIHYQPAEGSRGNLLIQINEEFL